jgi:hypothetical protein
MDRQRTLVNIVGDLGDAGSSPGKSRGDMPYIWPNNQTDHPTQVSKDILYKYKSKKEKISCTWVLKPMGPYSPKSAKPMSQKLDSYRTQAAKQEERGNEDKPWRSLPGVTGCDGYSCNQESTNFGESKIVSTSLKVDQISGYWKLEDLSINI